MFDFSKVYTEPINSQFILSRVSDSQIFSHYFGEFELGKVYSSAFRKDSSPSTGFYVGKTGKLIYNDLRTAEKLDCFAFVSKLFSISYGEAIKRVAQDFGLIHSSTGSVVSDTTLSRGLLVDKELKRKTIIQISPDKWSDEHLSFWREFEITKDELVANLVYPIKDLYINKKKIYNRNNYLRFGYLQEYEGEKYLKIYSPKDPNMKWVSNIPLNVPFGFDKLPHKSNTLIITKSQKDRIVLKKIFTDVIATQNESESALPLWIEEQIQSYDKKIIFWDNDPTGVENCKKFNEKGFGYFNIPRSYYEKFKIKDASDFVAFYGIDALRELFQEKGIL